jgi:hypothetical protein
VGGEAHVLGRGHHDVGHHAALEGAHAVDQHHVGDAARLLEALGQQPQRRRRLLVPGQAHEAPPAPGQHRAEDLPPALGGPVDHEVLARRGLPGPIDAALAPPRLLGLGHGPAEVSSGARVASGPGHGQEPLGRDASVGGLHLLGDHRGDGVGVLGQLSARRVERFSRSAPLDHPLHRLVGRAAQGGRPSIGPHLLIGGNDVHPLPR